jgi:subtilisin family serine protease
MSARSLLLLVLAPLASSCEPAPNRRAGSDPASAVPLAAVTRREPPRTATEKLSAVLRRQLAQLPTDTQLYVMVDLRDQLDPKGLAAQIEARARTRAERRVIAVELARRVADESQQRMRSLLTSLTARDAVAQHQGFTVVNRLLVLATPEAIGALADHPEVASILPGMLDQPIPEAYIRRRTERRAPRQAPARASQWPWTLLAIGADSAWRLGLSGAGTVVGIIDAGASAAHEQLRSNFRDGASSWHDPQGHSRSPADGLAGHGTGILSVALGRVPHGQSLGVAPGAQWVACIGLPEGRYSPIAATECAEWIFTTAQPDVVVNPWLIADTSCDRSLEPIVNAWRAAEILPVFAAGNEGPGPATGGSPANYVDLYPGGSAALSVGGVLRHQAVFPRSSRGPNRCNGGVYPVVVAPASDITVAYPLTPTMYVRTEGTSYAAGMVAGAAALLLQRHPEATVSELEEALRAGARDLGSPGADQDFGYGALDLPGAIAALDRIRTRRAATRLTRYSPE